MSTGLDVVAPPSSRPLPYYREVAGECGLFRLAYSSQLAVLLKGPTGCGKSRLVESMAAELGRPLISVACNDDTSAADLLGRWLVRGGDTVWQDGPVTRAVREGAILYLDEIAEAREDVIVVLHPLSDHRRELHLDRTSEVLKAAPEMMLVCSYNPGYRRGLKELKPSTKQRFIAIELGYPRDDIEVEIVAAEGMVDKKVAKKLVSLAGRIRTLEELGLTETASTRLLIAAARLIAAGLPARQACASAIARALTDDPATTEAIIDLGNLIF